jgi:hypothetical protein
VGDGAVCQKDARIKVEVLKRGEATQLGNGTVCQKIALRQVKVLQRGKTAQVGDAAVCQISGPRKVEELQRGEAGEMAKTNGAGNIQIQDIQALHVLQYSSSCMPCTWIVDGQLQLPPSTLHYLHMMVECSGVQ